MQTDLTPMSISYALVDLFGNGEDPLRQYDALEDTRLLLGLSDRFGAYDIAADVPSYGHRFPTYLILAPPDEAKAYRTHLAMCTDGAVLFNQVSDKLFPAVHIGAPTVLAGEVDTLPPLPQELRLYGLFGTAGIKDTADAYRCETLAVASFPILGSSASICCAGTHKRVPLQDVVELARMIAATRNIGRRGIQPRLYRVRPTPKQVAYGIGKLKDFWLAVQQYHLSKAHHEKAIHTAMAYNMAATGELNRNLVQRNFSRELHPYTLPDSAIQSIQNYADKIVRARGEPLAPNFKNRIMQL